jgi:arylsulfatase A-like enzyme
MSPRHALLALALGAASLLGCSTEKPPRPNILLISLDSVRYDELTPYGGKPIWHPDEVITPAIEALSQSGITFDRAISTTSWTLPSHMALLTGLPDPVHGVTDNHQRLDPGIVTLAEELGDAGYRTAGFFSGPNLHPVFGFSQGFDTYTNESSNHPDLAVFNDKSPGAMMPVHRASHEDVTSPALVAGANAFITEAAEGDDPFFCFVHFWDPHYDYVAPTEVQDRFTRTGFDKETSGVTGAWETDKFKRDWTPDAASDLLSLYHAELAFTDEYVGHLVARIDELGLGEDTLIVFVADHGEEFFEHGRWGHQRTLFDEVTRIPMILRWSGHLTAGTRVPGQARIQDVFATICDLTDVKLPAYASPETLFGESLRPLWLDLNDPGRDQLLYLNVPLRGVDEFGVRSATPLSDRVGDYKVLLDHNTGRAQLFDLTSDPGEHAPRSIGTYAASKSPAVHTALELEARFDAARAALPLVGSGEAELTPEVRAELQRLGYL